MSGVVAEAMITRPKVVDATATVKQAREQFHDDHVHAVLVVEAGKLVSVVERCDLADASPAAPVRTVGKLEGRTVRPDVSLDQARRGMLGRRLAVVDDRGTLLGLLCLKNSGRGFCSEKDVRDRATHPRVDHRPHHD